MEIGTKLNRTLRAFIERQHVFFVATAAPDLAPQLRRDRRAGRGMPRQGQDGGKRASVAPTGIFRMPAALVSFSCSRPASGSPQPHDAGEFRYRLPECLLGNSRVAQVQAGTPPGVHPVAG